MSKIHSLHAKAMIDTVDECLSRYGKTDADKLLWDAIISGWAVALIPYTHNAVREAFNEWHEDYKSIAPSVHDISAILERRNARPTIH